MAVHPAVHPSEEALRAFALGKLDDSTSSVLISHLDGCPDCCNIVAAFSGDDFLNRLRQAQGRSCTPAPAQSLASSLGSSKPPPLPSQTPIPNLPPELAANQQYKILRELGRGGMGVVYLAKNKLMDRLEVLKVISKTLLDRPGSVERFLREIRSAAKLSHANVVAAYSAVQQGDLLAFAMEYIEGQDLASAVKAQGPLPVVHACYYVQQAALGLQHAFEKGMVHRDIKPQNLILSREGKKHTIKVLDFGLAKVMREKHEDTDLTGEGAMLGTPDYIAPEQSLDAARADIRADIYSLGCTLYYLLSGRPPFSGSSLGAVLMAHQMQEAKPLNLVRSEVPEELAALVRKMMAKAPAKRYQTPLEVVQALAPFVKPGATAKSSPELSSGSMAAKSLIQKAVPVEPPSVRAAKEAKPQPEPAAVWESQTEGSSASIAPHKSKAIRKRRAATVRERTSPNKWLIGGGIGVGMLLLALVGILALIVFKVKTKDGIIVLEVDQPGAEVVVDEGKITVHVPGDNQPLEIQVEPGQHKLRISKTGFVAVTREIELTAGKSPPIKIKLIPVPVAERPSEKVVAARLQRAGASQKAADRQVAIVPPQPFQTASEPKKEPSEYVNSLGMKFRLIPAGTFIMGSDPLEIERCINLKLPWPPAEQFESEGPAHEVEITKPFYIGIHEVTVGQFRQFVKAMDYKTQAETAGGSWCHFPDGEWKKDGATNWRNPGFEQTDDHPVVCVNWNDVEAFCAWLSGKEGRTYRLPTESEWEYCCRAKTTTRFCCGDDETRLKEFANLRDVSCKQKLPGLRHPAVAWDDGYPFTAPVGHFRANAFGLHDMHGNVLEWCADWYDKDYYKNSPRQDPPGPNAGNNRVIRGGQFGTSPSNCRSASRNYFQPDPAYHIGFRVALLPEKRAAKADSPPTEQAPPPTTPRNDYDDLAKGRWVDVLPSVEEFNRLRGEKSYTGTEPKFADGILECNGTTKLFFPSIKAKDVIVRARMKRWGLKHAGNAGFEFRNAKGESVAGGFNGDGYFFIGRGRNKSWKDFAFCQLSSEPYGDFFDFALAIVGDRLIAYANGRKILEARDDPLLDRPAIIWVGTFRNCSGLFRNIEVQVLDKPSAEVKAPLPQGKGELPAEAAAAVKEFEKSATEARQKLLADFESVLDQLAKRKMAATLRLKLIDAVQAEKKRFESAGLIPWSEPMRTPLAHYFAATAAAERKLRRAYNSLIDAQLRAKNDNAVALLRAAQAKLIPIRVVARWKQIVDGNPGRTYELHSNRSGRAIGDGPAIAFTWLFGNGVLRVRAADANAPGGEWINTVKVSADGKTYAGSNQLGKAVITGVYATEN